MLKKYLMIFLVSMVPIVELRGAIPISQGFQLPLLQSYIICVIGNMLPVPIIYLFARRVLEWGKVYLPYWAVCFWQVLSWVLPVQDFSAHFLQSFKEKYKSGFKFINRTGSSRAWEFLIPEDARYFLPEIKENAKK